MIKIKRARQRVPIESPPPGARARSRALRRPRHRRLPDRPLVGPPFSLRGMRNAPTSEMGVVALFSSIALDLGYVIERIGVAFPDCEALRRVNDRHWQRVRIEFEYESRNFLVHGHDAAGCDVLVCWRHNWPEHPRHLEILELCRVLNTH